MYWTQNEKAQSMCLGLLKAQKPKGSSPGRKCNCYPATLRRAMYWTQNEKAQSMCLGLLKAQKPKGSSPGRKCNCYPATRRRAKDAGHRGAAATAALPAAQPPQGACGARACMCVGAHALLRTAMQRCSDRVGSRRSSCCCSAMVTAGQRCRRQGNRIGYGRAVHPRVGLRLCVTRPPSAGLKRCRPGACWSC